MSTTTVISAGSKWRTAELTPDNCPCRPCVSRRSNAALTLRLGAENVEVLGDVTPCENREYFARAFHALRDDTSRPAGAFGHLVAANR